MYVVTVNYHDSHNSFTYFLFIVDNFGGIKLLGIRLLRGKMFTDAIVTCMLLPFFWWGKIYAD